MAPDASRFKPGELYYRVEYVRWGTVTAPVVSTWVYDVVGSADDSVAGEDTLAGEPVFSQLYFEIPRGWRRSDCRCTATNLPNIRGQMRSWDDFATAMGDPETRREMLRQSCRHEHRGAFGFPEVGGAAEHNAAEQYATAETGVLRIGAFYYRMIQTGWNEQMRTVLETYVYDGPCYRGCSSGTCGGPETLHQFSLLQFADGNWIVSDVVAVFAAPEDARHDFRDWERFEDSLSSAAQRSAKDRSSAVAAEDECAMITLKGDQAENPCLELLDQPKLRAVVVYARGAPAEGLHVLADLPRLETLSLQGRGISNSTIGDIARLGRLKSLELRETAVNDAGLAALARVEALVQLFLTNSPVTDRGMDLLKDVPELRSLILGSLPLTDAAISFLRDAPTLCELQLVDMPMTDKGMTPLKELPELWSLSLSHLSISDAGLARIVEIPRLYRLRIFRTCISEHGLALLGGATELRNLDLRGERVSALALRHLSAIRKLRTLTLGSTGVSDAAMEYVGLLHKLERLHLDGTPITDWGIRVLEGLNALKYLNIERTQVSKTGVERLRAALPDCEVVC